MVASLPIEINWHDREAVYSVDFSPNSNRVVTAGADGTVRIWSIIQRPTSTTTNNTTTTTTTKTPSTNMPVEVDFLSELKRHTAPVNVARFSPSGLYIASAGDDTNVIIWKPTDVKQTTFGSGNADYEKESWVAHVILRGHTKEIYDLAWSPCGRYFITGAIDNTACVWSLEDSKFIQIMITIVEKYVNLRIYSPALEKCIKILNDHTHYVQGVSWDPLGKSIAIYRLAKDSHGNLVVGNCIKKHHKLDRSKYQTLTTENNHNEDSATGSTAHTGQTFRLFQDENLVSFFRRLSFTNDGALLITPAGVYKQTNDDNDMDTDDASNHGDSTSKNETQNTIYVYARNSITQQPVAFFGNYSKAAIAIKCSPIKYQLRSKNGITRASRFALPYRMIFAVATQDSVYVYDTQQSKPLCMLSGVHYASITDISWSSDGNVLMLTSNDGYCSVAVYDKDELGLPYEGEPMQAIPECMENVPEAEIVAVKATTPEPVRPLTVLDTWTRKVEPGTAAPPLVDSNSNKDNKRRITPTLVETKPSSEDQQQKKKRRIAPTLISSL
ncbi:hypothetical protein INT43_003474 [Umbelopsis isabellina]|uniref:CAF1B/HIR1 beta-propeller domain-containing protein n=1 Tax=Mortierella isabellina TaxID=91625 RepID=A0A8H7UAC7_MORIS|nr:hypothetical protein INT43_003474 [Umbelopsis isabellina]